MGLETFGAYLTLPPNWKAGIRVRTRWRTGIMEATTGAEQRSSLFTCPRWLTRFRLDTLSHSESNWLSRLFFNNLHKILGVPMWTDRTTLDSQALAGQKDLVCVETDYRRFVEGHPVVVMSPSDWSSYEVGEIDSITGGTITLVDNLTSTWAAGSDVFPLVAAHLKSMQEVSHETDYVSSTIIDVASTMEDVPNPAAYSYDSVTDFWPAAIKPDWSSNPKLKTKHPYELAEFLGVATSESNYGETTWQWKARFVCTSKAEIWALLSIFNGKRGRFGSMFVPTWRSDIVITGAFGAANYVIEIADIDYYSKWWPTSTARFVSFDFPDGTIVNRRIVEVVDPTHIKLNQPLGKSAAADEVRHVRVSFMPYARFHVDELDLKYEHENLAWTTLTFSSLPKETLDVMTTTTTTSTTSTTTTVTTTTVTTSTVTTTTVTTTTTTVTTTTVTTTTGAPSSPGWYEMSPGVGSDDGYWGDDGYFNAGAYYYYLGYVLGQQQSFFIRLPNCPIPSGAKIVEAFVRLTAHYTRTGTPVHADVHFNDVDDAVAPTNNGEAEGKVLTSNKADWDNIPGWTDENQYDTPSLKLPLQEVIDRGGWQQGNALMLLAKDAASSSFRQAASIEHVPDEKPVLHVYWNWSGTTTTTT